MLTQPTGDTGPVPVTFLWYRHLKQTGRPDRSPFDFREFLTIINTYDLSATGQHLTTDQEAEGSNPSGRATTSH